MTNIYLDNAASTALDKEVYNTIMPYLLDQYGIPSAHHGYGRDAKAAIETSRAGIAKLLNALPEEIVFTSGAAEADSLAIQSAVNCALIDHVITTPFEHEAVLKILSVLQRKHDVRISYIRHDAYGKLDLNHLEFLLRTNTRNLVSVAHTGSEIGNLNDIERIGLLCEKYKALFHTDAAQTVGKYRHDLSKLKVNFLAASAHKFHGPKGIGFLYCRKGTRLAPTLHGSVTANIPGIIGLNTALNIAYRDMDNQANHIRTLKARMIQQLEEQLPLLIFNGNPKIEAESSYSILNISLPGGAVGHSLLQYLDNNQVAVSGGDSSSSPSLKALGVKRGTDSIRFSFSKYNTIAEIDRVVELLATVYQTVAA